MGDGLEYRDTGVNNAIVALTRLCCLLGWDGHDGQEESSCGQEIWRSKRFFDLGPNSCSNDLSLGTESIRIVTTAGRVVTRGEKSFGQKMRGFTVGSVSLCVSLLFLSSFCLLLFHRRRVGRRRGISK
jgi:hypothetical protein